MRAHDNEIRGKDASAVENLGSDRTFSNLQIDGYVRDGFAFSKGLHRGEQLVAVCSRHDERREGRRSWRRRSKGNGRMKRTAR